MGAEPTMGNELTIGQRADDGLAPLRVDGGEILPPDENCILDIIGLQYCRTRMPPANQRKKHIDKKHIHIYNNIVLEKLTMVFLLKQADKLYGT